MKNQLTITIPRSQWLRGSSSNGNLCVGKADNGDYSLCIMGFIGQALGIRPADMVGIEFLERVRDLRENGFYESEAIKLYRRGILLSGDEDDNFSVSSPAAVLAMTANDDWALTDPEREAYLQDLFLNSFSIIVRFVDDSEEAAA